MSKMSKRTRDYVGFTLVLLILIFTIIIINLPKVGFISLGVVAVTNIILYEVFGFWK